MPGALEPVGVEEFSNLLEHFAPPISAPIALAVSGGPDSMALAFCMKRWSSCNIVAFIVEHGLRAEAAQEAAGVKESLEKMGIPTEILSWKHEPVTGRLHEKARDARYKLLTSACRRHGARDLLLAHHRDDQAETILMRLAKGSGVEGLAGMAEQTAREDIRILRPFLSLPKERLIATCCAAHVPFVTDTSNKLEKFARGRLRKVMPLLTQEGMTVESLVNLGVRAAEAKEALEYYTKDFLQKAAQAEVGGNIRIDRALLREVPRAISLRAISSCLRYMHDGGYPPEYAALSSLLDVVVSESHETIRTLYGCIASVSREKVMLLREPSAAIEMLPFNAEEPVLWDQRWLVAGKQPQNTPSLTIRALGTPPHELIDRLAPNLRHKIPQGRIRASLPALWKDGEIFALPSFDGKTAFQMIYARRSIF